MKKIIKNGTIYIDGKFEKKDILINEDLIEKIDNEINAENAEIVDAEGNYVFPGFVDLHAHLRDPGQTNKEDIVSGTKAAAKGGFTTICAMPNTDPIVDNVATVEYIKRKAKDLGSAKVEVIGALTKKSEGKEISEIASMIEYGIVAVSDDGHCVQNAKIKLNAMKYASSFNIPVIVHAEEYNLAGSGQINAGKYSTKLGLSGIPALAEEIIIARDIMLAESSKCRLHIAHVSTAKAVDLIREAKRKGIAVTCEVTPHHLLLTEDLCENFDTNTKVKPPLRTDIDRLACIEGLKDGTIDFIATDHAPHADYEKEREFVLAPFGINGFESAFASLYSGLVLKNVISLELLIEKMASAPAKFIQKNIGELKEGKAADITIVDLKDTICLTSGNMLSKSKNTPFLNQELSGKVIRTFCNGNETWRA